ncbi:sensor histidine kinase [Xylocopilactobacillus apicola]|uniref:histidine kinase n=1 Tax=Xylocopilactobacillus apicola TaxID=2932184 RepID=A0AAU9DHL2_9LACO|nr:sensor histidine kinase [Xylocopilactobacillus apicola]BDR59505.1 signal transduction histidine kinase [Xylocopilactobacillus apicola]
MIKLYLKSNWLVIAGPLILLAIAALMTELLAKSNELLFNTIFVGFWPVFILWVIDFMNFKRHCQKLKQQQNSPIIDLTALPETNDSLAQIYQELLHRESSELDQLKTQLVEVQTDTYETLQLWTHQIKTPLTALDLLLQVNPVDQVGARLEVEKIDRYLRVMLNYLKLTTVNTDLVLRSVNLTVLVQETVRDLAKLFIAKDLRVKVLDLPTVVSDSQWLKFIFEQVLTNSIKYTPEGEIKIYAKGDAIIFSDTGIGILPEDLPRIFEQGYSGYNGRENQKASGLGLYLSNQIALKLGLKMTATSTVGTGTEISIHFPQRAWIAE